MDGLKSDSDAKMEHLAALHHECMTRAKEISEQLGVKIPDEIASFVTETTFRFCHILASDLESFCRHAKRSTINMDDVVLFARRNPNLIKFLEDKSAEYATGNDIEDTNSDVQPAKRKRQPKLQVEAKSNKGSSKSKDSAKSSPLKAFFSHSNQSTSKSITTARPTSPSKTPIKDGQMDIVAPTRSAESVSDELEVSTKKLQDPRVSTPRKDDLGSSACGAFGTSLFDDKEDFSNIFDDFDI
ncbi:hypothetical protein Aperf_G00000018069 [Anoplocephala perfoliata]